MSGRAWASAAALVAVMIGLVLGVVASLNAAGPPDRLPSPSPGPAIVTPAPDM